MTPVLQETDSLNSLEQRIQQAIQLVSRLRAEKDSALEQAAQARAESARLAEDIGGVQGKPDRHSLSSVERRSHRAR